MPSKNMELLSDEHAGFPLPQQTFDHQQLEACLLKLNNLALRGQTAACTGHELNNQLTIGYGNLEMAAIYLQNNQLTAARDHIECAMRVLKQTFQLSHSLFDYLPAQPEFRPLSLNELLEEIVQNTRPLLKKQRAKLDLELDETLPSIRADSGQINQVVINMIHNALQTTIGVTLTIATSYDAKSRMVKCHIRDNGPGMSVEKLRKLFTFRYSDREGGHGLGLFVCKEIVTRHNGTISVASKLGKGTAFTISLPLATARAGGVMKPGGLSPTGSRVSSDSAER